MKQTSKRSNLSVNSREINIIAVLPAVKDQNNLRFPMKSLHLKIITKIKQLMKCTFALKKPFKMISIRIELR